MTPLSDDTSLADLAKLMFAARNTRPTYACQFETMLKWLRVALRRKPKVADLRAEILAMFRQVGPELGMKPSYVDKLVTRFVGLWRFAESLGVAAPCKYARRRRPGPEALPPPVGEPGTLLALFWDRYMPETRIKQNQVAHFFATFRKLRDAFGGDVRLAELNAAYLAKFKDHLAGLGLKPLAVRAHVNRLMALWRFAHREGLVGSVPYQPKERLQQEVPDAWSIDEFSRIVAAAGRLCRPPIGGVPADKFWPAILLVGYYTAARRGTLLKLRPADVDLKRRIVRVPAAMMKNGVGQVFRIGQDAVAALRAIWDAERERIFPAPIDGGDCTFLYDHFRVILRAAGVAMNESNRMSLFHKVRRTAVTLTAANAGMAQAIALAGHSGPDVNRRYIDPSFLPQYDSTSWLPAICGSTVEVGGQTGRVAGEEHHQQGSKGSPTLAAGGACGRCGFRGD